MAMHNLGLCYAQGTGVARDVKLGAQWVMKAAKLGNLTAQMEYGIMLIKGRGVTKDKNEGMRWIWTAADQGDHEALEFLRTGEFVEDME
jgi:TPR repeat protein